MINETYQENEHTKEYGKMKKMATKTKISVNMYQVI